MPVLKRIPSTVGRALATPVRVWLFVLIAYLAASFFSVTIKRYQPLPQDLAVRYKKNAWAVISTPRVLRGEEPHFLMMAHSLGYDGDLYLSREYTSALLGGPEMGVYLRGRPAEYIFQHFSRKPDFTLVGNHPPGISILLASLLWPLAGSTWMEPAAIWVTALTGALGVLTFLRVLECLEIGWAAARNTALALAFATPWFSYSRTLYTEVYIGTAFLILLLAMLRGRWLLALPFCAVMAWFKFPALLLFAAGAAGALAPPANTAPATSVSSGKLRRAFGRIAQDHLALKRACLYAGAGTLTFLAIFAFNRAMYADTTWFTRVSSVPASIVRAGAPIAWLPGDVPRNIKRLFTDYDKGIFPHCPLLLFALGGIWIMARRHSLRRQTWLLLACALPWTALHVCYRYFMVGDSYTTRYLVPVIPLAMAGMPFFWQWSARRHPAWRYAAALALALSALNNILAGFFPGLSFDKSPLEIWHGAWMILRAVVIQ
jgi:hypothetical protein